MRRIYITEEQISRLTQCINEGIDYRANQDKSINATVNSKKDDKSNIGFDTRLFGKKGEILNGDGTNNGMSLSFSDKINQRKTIISVLNSLIEWVKGGRIGNFNINPNISSTSQKAIMRALALPDEELLSWASQTLERYSSEYSVIKGKYDRVSQSPEGSTQERYHKGVVPGTDISVIALFDISDFNVSDLMKHGEVRQGPLADKLLNISKDQREKNIKVFGGQSSLKRIPVTYDNGIKANVASNFSIDPTTGVEHSNRKRYGYGDEDYTSVARFLDKSISYAAYVLNKERINPSYILAAPSSSKYNDYYCQRLSEKIGVEYVRDFFSRNIINVVFDEEGMRNAGFSDERINETAMDVKSAIMGEMVSILKSPLKKFIANNWQYLSQIRLRKSARSFVSESDIATVLLAYAYDELSKIIFMPGSQINDNVSKIILNRTIDKKSNYLNLDYVREALSNIINRYCMADFTKAIRTMAWSLAGFHDKILNGGLALNFESRGFKIVSFEKRIRPYIRNAYIIADKELNRDGNLFTRYKSANFLLFDEDMNSGATLKILADAMNDKGVSDEQITCLVNAYSPKGA